MDQIDFTARKDPFLHSFQEPLKALNGLVPFLLMGRPLSRPISLAFSAYRVGVSGYQLYRGEKKQAALSLAHTTAHTALTLFSPAYVPLFQALCQIGKDLAEGCDFKATNQALYIASLLFKRPEVIAASLFTQALTEFHEAYEAENKWEGVSKICLALFRLVGMAGQLKEAHRVALRNQLWREIQGMETGLTRPEFDAIIDYSDRHTRILEATRIKGGENDLPRSITVTPDALYIHLKSKGGMEPLGQGAFKRAYVCLKIEDHHAKRMAELTVRHYTQMALDEDALAKKVGSAHIAGGAEVSLLYGHKLCLIQDLMDTDGWHYSNDPTATAADRFRVMEGVALGLGDLHRAGYTHGDLHPGNMLVNTGGPHTGKLSDLGLAKEMPVWNSAPERNDLRCLAHLVHEVCGPAFARHDDNPSVAALRGRCRQIITDPHAEIPSAYELAGQLRLVRLSLGERRTIPLRTGTTLDLIPSPVGFDRSTLPSMSVLEKLPIHTASVMRVLGWPGSVHL